MAHSVELQANTCVGVQMLFISAIFEHLSAGKAHCCMTANFLSRFEFARVLLV